MSNVKTHWLDSVKAKAEFNYLRRLREEKEAAALKEGKKISLEPVVVEEPVKKGTK